MGLLILSIQVTTHYSWVQPLCIGCGAAMVVLGLLLPRRPDDGRP